MKSSYDRTVDLTPMSDECLRCHTPTTVRFSGLCQTCTEQLRSSLGNNPVASSDDVPAAFEPEMHVTPNAVALKDD